ncbi:hypothetical protein BD779DRAFT_1476312 [Infundibulicybe gibba]|nr:hypothetical protein BD779DRAFT_1476312 [Infundibulicybe gibba]
MSTRVTRPTNKTAHPGLIDVDEKVLRRSTRSHAETKAEKIAGVEAKQKAAIEKAAALQIVGDFEARMAKADQENELNAALATLNDTVDEGGDKEQRNIDKPEDEQGLDEADEDHEMQLDPKADEQLDDEEDEEHIDDDQEPVDSDDDLENEGYPGNDEVDGVKGAHVDDDDLGDAPGNGTDDLDEEDHMEEESDHETPTKIAKPASKPKAKVPAALYRSPPNRRDTNIDADLPEILESTTQHGKRKASTVLASTSFKKNKLALPSGIHPGWTPPASQARRPANKTINIQTPKSHIKGPAAKPCPTQTPKPCPTQTPNPRQAKSAKADEREDSPSDDGYKYGGFVGSDEDEDDEVSPFSLPLTQQPKKEQVNSKAANLASSNSSSATTTPPRTSKRYGNGNLPEKCLDRWQREFIPRWLHIMGTSETPWFTDIKAAQKLWDTIFTDIPRTLKPTGEAVFCVLKQRTYEWRNQFALHATHAVEAFWKMDRAYNKPANRASYVAWAIPENSDNIMPLIWARVDERDPENIVYTGKFLAKPIIHMFAFHHLLATLTVPVDCRGPDKPVGALVLATTAVERAFGTWATGEFIAPGPKEKFTSLLAPKTALYVDDLKTVVMGWPKIEAAGMALLENQKKQLALPKASSSKLPRAPTPRSLVVDADEAD